MTGQENGKLFWGAEDIKDTSLNWGMFNLVGFLYAVFHLKI